MFVVCPRLVFIPAWVGRSSNACQMRSNACSIMILPTWGRRQRDRETSGRRKECTSTHWFDSNITSGYRESSTEEQKRKVCILMKPYDFTAFSRCLGCPWQSQQVAETLAHRLPVSVLMSLAEKQGSHLTWRLELFTMRWAWGGRGCHFLAIRYQFVTPFCGRWQNGKGGQELHGLCTMGNAQPLAPRRSCVKKLY